MQILLWELRAVGEKGQGQQRPEHSSHGRPERPLHTDAIWGMVCPGLRLRSTPPPPLQSTVLCSSFHEQMTFPLVQSLHLEYNQATVGWGGEVTQPIEYADVDISERR